MKTVKILVTSLLFALQEFRSNKFRTFLSLFGITVGIFCISGVLSAVDSLEAKVQGDLQRIGNNTIYIDKWQYGGGPDVPWWKFINRPIPLYHEVDLVKKSSTLAANVAYINNKITTIRFQNSDLSNVAVYCVSEEFNQIKNIDIFSGRYINESEFVHGSPVAVIGYSNAELLFGTPEKAVGKTIYIGKQHVSIIGVIAKQGLSFIGTDFDYDKSLIVSYKYFARVWNPDDPNDGQPIILVHARKDVPNSALVDELTGIMRRIRKLKPKEEDNFAINDINTLGDQISSVFGSITTGGWAIAILSLVVGGFSIANIMFVTVKERTGQIGLKKAIGAKNTTILAEYLLESIVLCLLGGMLGLFMVYLLSIILSQVLPFPIFITSRILWTAFSVCIVLGVLSGFIPARSAARMNPIDAIRNQ